MAEFVVPEEGSLEIESRGCVCAIEGCGKGFQSSSQLRMHQLKHHQGKELSSRSGNTKYLYFCPVERCERGKGSGKPFPRLGQLKQHYQRMHGTREFACERCGKKFSLRDAHSRHVSECGRDFLCETCGETFKTRNSLYKHARRKGHTLPKGSKPRGKRPEPSSLLPPAPPLPVVTKLPIPRLRRSNLVSNSTQTHHVDLEVKSKLLSPPPAPPLEAVQDSECEENLQSILLDLSTQTECYQLDLSTQTDLCSEMCSSLEQLDLGTLTRASSDLNQLDLSTQTESRLDLNFNLSDLATQTEFLTTALSQPLCETSQSTSHQGCQTGLDPHSMLSPPPPMTGEDMSYSGTDYGQVNPEFCDFQSVEFGTQTARDSQTTSSGLFSQLEDLQSVEFGTQTQYSTEDPSLATQTTLGGLYSQFEAVEFGTETKDLSLATQTTLGGLYSQFEAVELGTQTKDPSLALQTTFDSLLEDFSTQTQYSSKDPPLTSSQDLYSPFDDLGCVEFGTQTQFNRTQAAGPPASVSSGSLGCQMDDSESVEFGTQTQYSADDLLPIATQTSSEDLLFYSELSRLPSVEFGTQTPFLSEDQLGMGTQTSSGDLYDFTSLQSRSDFGTQTIEELFSSTFFSPNAGEEENN